MKILVTGGAGFIGCNFVRLLLNLDKDYEVVNFDKLTYAGSLDNIKDVMDKPNHKFIKGDICEKQEVEKACENVDWIINFAAESHVDYSISNPEIFTKTNVLGTQNLLEIARKKDISFLQISTDEVYGDKVDGSFSEEDALFPSNPYSASKAAAEMLVHSYQRTYGIKTRTTRTTNNIGPFQLHEKLVPKFTIAAILEKPITIHGKGDQIRDFLYVEDNARAIELVLEKGKDNEVYNIGADNEASVVDVAKKIVSTLNKSEDLIEYVENRPGQDVRYSLNFEKIKNLGWSPKNNFEDSLKKTINWYLENKWWWQPKVENYDFRSRQAKN